MYTILFSILFGVQAVVSHDNVDTSVRVDLGGRTSTSWTETFMPFLSVDVSEGPAAELVRQSPSSYILCVSAGESLSESCVSIVDTIELHNLAMQPLLDGITEISAWIQSKHDPPNVLLHAIGKPTFLYAWGSPRDAIAGLSHRLPSATGYRKAAIELHLSLALAQSAIDDEENDTIMLHLGGHKRQIGWNVVDINVENEVVDVIAAMDDLHMYEDGSVTAVYASHILEHGSIRQTSRCGGSDGVFSGGDTSLKEDFGLFAAGGEIARTLREWHRVLKPGGLLFIAVPDLAVLAKVYLNGNADDREYAMNIMYGGQTTPYDFHSVGFDFDLLNKLLTAIGFCTVSRVEGPFGLFEDCSNMYVLGEFLSLNVIATACHPSGSDFDILRQSDPDGFKMASNAMRKDLLQEVYEVRSRVQVPVTVTSIYND